MPRLPLINISWVLIKTPDFIPGCGFFKKTPGFDENIGVWMKRPVLGLNPTFSISPQGIAGKKQ